MAQQQLFDRTESDARKKAGMQQAEDNSPTDLEIARKIARELAKKNPENTTTADQVGDVLWRKHKIRSLGPSAGSLFRGSEWHFTGQRVRSTRVTNHSREIKVWQLKPQEK